MDQALVKTLLESPLPLRLALLEADPAGAGWFINKWGRDVFRTAGESIESVTDAVADGTGAWLPCSPLAIVEHARDLYGFTARVRVDQPDYGGWRCSLVVPAEVRRRIPKAKTLTARHACPHTAAVALLRKVIG